MKLTNLEMTTHLNTLNMIKTKVTGKLGFAVAKNIRRLANELTEFEAMKNELVLKYGKPDETGNVSIKIDSEGYDQFLQEINEYCKIEQNIDIFKVDEQDIWNSSLNADEILKLDFMINEGQD